MIKYLFVFTVLAYSLSACKTIEPALPDRQIKELPRLEQKTSSLDLPIEIDLTPYLKDVEKGLDKTFRGKEDNCSGVSYSYRFERNPIKFDGKGQQLTYEVTGKYALNLNYCPECTYLFDGRGNCVVPRIYASCGVGEAMRRVKVAYGTKVVVSPDYKLKAKTELTKFETIDPCEITVFSYDATDKLRKEVTGVLKDLEKEIDKSISEVDVRSQIEEVWKMLSAPQSIGGYGFLSIQPRNVALSTINFDDKKAKLQINLAFQPVVTTHDPGNSSSPLPKLSEYKQGNGFEIHLDLISTYDSLTSILSREINGKSIEIKKNLIIFDSVGVESAAGSKLNIWVKFSGKKKGKLYLVGTPTFNSIEQIISFPDLEFDIKTKNALLKSAEWMFNPKITELIRQQAKFDLKPHLESMKGELNKEINREITTGIYLKGNLDEVNIDSIFPLGEQLVVRAFASGKLSLKM
jgi:hypothetical protein